MTATEPTTARIPCPLGCGGDVEVSHDELRELVEADQKPDPCLSCLAKMRRERQVTLKTSKRHKVDAVLLAMLGFEEDIGEGRAFFQSAIITEAWLLEDGYSMPGYEGVFPDSHRVLMDITKLFKCGFITKPKPCHYALTEKGRARARMFHRAKD